MNHRSKREVAPSPPSDGFVGAHAGLGSTLSASLQTSMPPGPQPVWCNGPLPHPTTNLLGSASPDCGMDLRPLGGFLSFFQSGQPAIFPPHVPFPAPFPPMAPPPDSSTTEHSKSKSKHKSVINIDDGADVRTAKRLTWDKEEDLRLVSAWLYHTNDPINGNGKKNESYWSDVVELYNTTTPANRKREIKHLKDRWVKIKRCVAFFCASWKKATIIYTSGYSDDQLRDIAHQFYVDDYPKEGPFTVEHCWKVLRDECKWHAILEDQDKSNKRSLDDAGQLRLKTEDIGEKERPIGTKEAKRQRNGKGKSKVDDASFQEDMKKYMDVQAAASKRHEEFLEAQQRVCESKVEAARLRREAILLESYQKMMLMDTREMSDDMKAEHASGLKMLRDKLTGKTN